jgi:hypothetical protein
MLRYASTGKVGSSAARKIQEEIGQIRRPWWRGAIGFDVDETGQPVDLSGATALFHKKQGIPDEDDLFMAFVDAAFILDRLADWSNRFKIKWNIGMNEDDWGAIDPTGLSRRLLKQVEKWARRARVPSGKSGRWGISAERHEELFRKHKGR